MLLEDLMSHRVIARGLAQAPLAGHTSARPEVDEVVVFRNFFTAGLHLP